MNDPIKMSISVIMKVMIRGIQLSIKWVQTPIFHKFSHTGDEPIHIKTGPFSARYVCVCIGVR